MRIIKIAYDDDKHNKPHEFDGDQKHPHDLDDPMGHVSIAEMKDYHKGFIVGWRKNEVENHCDECPRCMDNFITIKNNLARLKIT